MIAGVAETRYSRHSSPEVSTADLLAEALTAALDDAGLNGQDIDGLALSSFTFGPDTAMHVAWKLGLRLSWLLEDRLGGASALNMLRQAEHAVAAGDATVVAVVAGDRFVRDEFSRVSARFNRIVEDELAPIGYDGPNAAFALLTQRHMGRHGLGREDYAAIPIAQRGWAARNPGAVYREPLTLEEYLAAPIVAHPLCLYDCVPRVSGADALVVAAECRELPIVVSAFRAAHNADDQQGDGLRTGLADIADELWNEASLGPDDLDILSIYDDYPVMVLVQLADLGIAPDPARFLHDRLPTTPLNTSGGQLSAGQAGAAGGMHGLVEAVRQLRGQAGQRQIPNARTALVTGYGMVLYRHGACANAAVLERPEA